MIRKAIDHVKEQILEIECDRCHQIDDNPIEIQEYLSYRNIGGYGSIIGDGTRWSIDLCQQCMVYLLGNHIQKDVL